jgi:hypothetical protein
MTIINNKLIRIRADAASNRINIGLADVGPPVSLATGTALTAFK